MSAGGDGQERMVRSLLRHPEATIIGGVALLAVLAWSLWFFQPWLNFVDTEVHEPRPRGQVFAGGGIRGAGTRAEGRVLFIEDAEGARWVRLEDLVVDNGPGLRVVLSSASGSGAVLVGFDGSDRFDLGALRGNVGDASYDIPGFVDLRRFGTVVVVNRSGDALAFAPITS